MNSFFYLTVVPMLLQAPVQSSTPFTMYIILTLLATGIFFLVRKLLSINSVKNFLNSSKFAKTVPVILFLFFLPLYNIGTESLDAAMRIDSWRDIKTYTPYIGDDLRDIVNLADQTGLLPTFDRSPEIQELMNFASIVHLSSIIGLVLVIGLGAISMYGIFNIEKIKKQTLKHIYWGISTIFIIITIFSSIQMQKFVHFLTQIIKTNESNGYEIIFIIPSIIVIVVLGVIYKFYIKSLDIAYEEK